MVQVLFTPGDDVTGNIVQHLMAARSEILVQAYSFTSQPIIDALIAKHQEGNIRIIIMLDKSQEKSNQNALRVIKAGIRVIVDYKLKGIAHNKVIVIDRSMVFTGSFNFSKAAQYSNAENSLLIKDRNLVEKYFFNFVSRMNECREFNIIPKKSGGGRRKNQRRRR
ncbi:endonuclease protein [Angomonas deanei]|uniref:Mitochondrial cardiolipin hydrolase n=1 Tax=Angomonas deanei TaxID=59799 RepID=A0A7G2C1I3_9TRYP|nr:endonuclease protein [Angomonas deanei]CAD2213580.1 PLD-like domain containing protein, putative [Angomonas deanei]|eukprot:EPY16057.1 endonuclease protein [Angomonas deanei]